MRLFEVIPKKYVCGCRDGQGDHPCAAQVKNVGIPTTLTSLPVLEGYRSDTLIPLRFVAGSRGVDSVDQGARRSAIGEFLLLLSVLLCDGPHYVYV